MAKTILIYDDDCAELYAKGIQPRSSHLCLPYQSARRLNEELDRGIIFDLFLTDLAVEDSQVGRAGNVLTPDYQTLTGHDLGEKVRKMYPHLPIITWSGYSYKPDFSTCHLVKPISLNEILETINSFL
ncbi:MAG: hypothetical protein KKB21_05195 [Nanoarchaeota archaeon]|nr:hypothetical protein [Nanoarchaeota archaeon]